MPPTQVADKTWVIFREEGAVIEEALEDDGCRNYTEKEAKTDETADSPSDVVVSTSLNEKSGDLNGYQADVVDINPDNHSTTCEDDEDFQ
jgi:hypothetical protein